MKVPDNWEYWIRVLQTAWIDVRESVLKKLATLVIVILLGTSLPLGLALIGKTVPSQLSLIGGLFGAVLAMLTQILVTPPKLDKKLRDQIASLEKDYDESIFQDIKGLYEARLCILEQLAGPSWKPKNSPWGMEHAFFHENEKVRNDARNFVRVNLQQMQNEFNAEEVFEIKRKGGFSRRSIRNTSFESLIIEGEQSKPDHRRTPS